MWPKWIDVTLVHREQKYFQQQCATLIILHSVLNSFTNFNQISTQHCNVCFKLALPKRYLFRMFARTNDFIQILPFRVSVEIISFDTWCWLLEADVVEPSKARAIYVLNWCLFKKLVILYTRNLIRVPTNQSEIVRARFDFNYQIQTATATAIESWRKLIKAVELIAISE